MKRNRSFYCKQIARALKHANKGKSTYGNELRFYDNLDWEVIEDRGVWTDVYLEYEGNSVFAFTVSSSLAARGEMTGSVPEAIRDNETGLWDLYIHKKYISEKDVGKACRKWVELQGPNGYICTGCNVYFNEQRMGHVWTSVQYPRDRDDPNYNMDEKYRIESFAGPIKMNRGICS